MHIPYFKQNLRNWSSYWLKNSIFNHPRLEKLSILVFLNIQEIQGKFYCIGYPIIWKNNLDQIETVSYKGFIFCLLEVVRPLIKSSSQKKKMGKNRRGVSGCKLWRRRQNSWLIISLHLSSIFDITVVEKY